MMGMGSGYGPSNSMEDDVIRQTHDYLEKFTKLKGEGGFVVHRKMRQISHKYGIKDELMILI